MEDKLINGRNPLILLVDDEEVALAVYSNLVACQDSREVLPILSIQPISLVLLDLSMPFITGQELLEQIKEEYPAVPVVIITGEDDLETAVTCMKMGAFDFMSKPVNRTRLISVVGHAVEMQELQLQVSRLTNQVLVGELQNPEAFSEIVAGSESMRSIFKYIEAVAGSPKPILITGESGTGKELAARAIHMLSRPAGEFVSVNVSGLDDTVFSDTLFGHTRGAFTGADAVRKGLIERASDGTLFLDEIGDLEMSSQVKRLRLLQEQEYYPLGSDVAYASTARVITATNADLTARQAAGSFRKDLYYRLVAHHIHLPPLRERLEDLPLLIDHFFNEAVSALGKTQPSVPDELSTLLGTYDFPGNVRELQSMIFDTLSRHEGGVLSLGFFRDYMKEHRDSAQPEGVVPAAGAPRGGLRPGESSPGGSLPGGDSAKTIKRLSYSGQFPTLKEVEAYFISEALEKAKGNQSIAAQLLGVSQSTLSRRLSGKTG